MDFWAGRQGFRMLLTIDCGNTDTGFAVFDHEVKQGSWRIATHVDRTPDEYAVWMRQLMGLVDLTLADISAAAIASVVPDAIYALKSFVLTYCHVEPLVVGEPEVILGVNILIDRPEQVGADRLVNTVAAQVAYSGELIVIDFGTATTFDIVDEEGNFAGSIIAPGINLSMDALCRASAQLPRISIKRPENVIGKATVPAMQSGVFWGYVAMIEGLVARICAERGSSMRVVATGGLASLFAGVTDSINEFDLDLTMRGLVEIHRRNTDR